MQLHKLSGALLALVLVCLPAGVFAQEAPLGSELPLGDRAMTSVDGSSATLSSLQGSAATAIIFWSNQCPWVERYEDRVQQVVSDYTGRGVSFVLVNANDSDAYPQESQAESAERASSLGYEASYVIDAGSELATALGASRTPHVYVFDNESRLVYVGSIDDSPGDPGNVERTYLGSALDAIISGATVDVPQTKAFGCTIRFSQ